MVLATGNLQPRPPGGPDSWLYARVIRREVARAAVQGVPWQRVFDAARPASPGIWHDWTPANRRQFARHLRVRWDMTSSE